MLCLSGPATRQPIHVLVAIHTFLKGATDCIIHPPSQNSAMYDSEIPDSEISDSEITVFQRYPFGRQGQPSRRAPCPKSWKCYFSGVYNSPADLWKVSFSSVYNSPGDLWKNMFFTKPILNPFLFKSEFFFPPLGKNVFPTSGKIVLPGLSKNRFLRCRILRYRILRFRILRFRFFRDIRLGGMSTETMEKTLADLNIWTPPSWFPPMAAGAKPWWVSHV